MTKNKGNDKNQSKIKKDNMLPLFSVFSTMDEITEILPNGEMNSKNDVNPHMPQPHDDMPSKPHHTL